MITYATYIFCSVYGLWLFYLAVMNLKRAQEAGALSRAALVLGYPILLIGLALDWAVNVVLTLPFLDVPASPSELVTGRLKRYAYDKSQTWRRSAAVWFAENLLDTFDPSGKHI